VFDIFGVTVLIALAALATWLIVRARRAKNPALKWTGLVLSSLFGVVFTLAILFVLVGFYKINFPPSRPSVKDIKVAGTPDQVARGARFASFCATCHSPNGKPPLVGVNFFQGGPPFGTMYAPNLTPAGEIKDWSDGEIIRAIREGVHKSGRSLVVMPSDVFHHMSDADVQAIVAYLRSQPAAGQQSPPTKLSALGALLLGAGLAPTSAQPAITHPIIAPAEGTSADYGKYLVSNLGCTQCHGEKLAGIKRRGPGPPIGPNLTMLLPSWSEDGFVRTLRTGVDPNNYKLKEGMPWKEISAFATDADLKAMYSYLHSLKPIEGPK
jgi:mono/diheme cytochrome c family protein